MQTGQLSIYTYLFGINSYVIKYMFGINQYSVTGKTVGHKIHPCRTPCVTNNVNSELIRILSSLPARRLS